MTISVSDFVMEFLADRGAGTLYVLSGGGIMYLLDSLGRSERLSYVCCRHEQACAVAAEGHARITGAPGVALVTTGPGAANAASGVLGAWTDSLPLLVLSGQVRRDLIADFTLLRQKGPQEGDTLTMVAPFTKYAAAVTDPARIRATLERAWSEATSGRPGPVWVELPVDVQAAQVDPADLDPYVAPQTDAAQAERELAAGIRRAAEALRRARRPLLLCGSGVRSAGAAGDLRRLLDVSGLPAIVPDSGKDLIPEDHPSNLGVFGPAAQRRANFAVQNCDCLVALAAALSAKKIGFNYADFARNAHKTVVDVDGCQLRHQVVRPDDGVCGDVRAFLRGLCRVFEETPYRPPERWLEACAGWKSRYPLVTAAHHADADAVNSYAFMDVLADVLTADDVLTTGNGLDSVSYVQAYRVKEGQRTLLNSNWGAMGWDLPLAVGACVGSGRKRTVCVTGDGSVQLNIQELATIAYYGLPVTVFIFNNRGYATIRATQRNLLDGRLVASGETSGVDNPDFALLAGAYGLGYSAIASNVDLRAGIESAVRAGGPHLCEVRLRPEQEIEPKSTAFRRDDGTLESRPLEDMAPFLSREEVWHNMHLFDDEPVEGGR